MLWYHFPSRICKHRCICAWNAHHIYGLKRYWHQSGTLQHCFACSMGCCIHSRSGSQLQGSMWSIYCNVLALWLSQLPGVVSRGAARTLGGGGGVGLMLELQSNSSDRKGKVEVVPFRFWFTRTNAAHPKLLLLLSLRLLLMPILLLYVGVA